MIELPHGLCVYIYIYIDAHMNTYDIYGGPPRGAALSW